MPTERPLIKYRSIVETRRDLLAVDITSALGPEAAARRAQWTIIASRRHGDIDDIKVIATYLVCTWFAMCDNQTETLIKHPVFGEIPICDRCRAIVGPQPA